ncbi:ATP-binding protein [Dialister sp.]|uniref:ATP-binding protein n=1 Tax=Dialister sp. TaxID=1955814 RepID=UPI002E811B57|nr:ATP-binding protein [Dialister sp.]MEE3453882.1 ATP-binding protein [Dialister sp.]
MKYIERALERKFLRMNDFFKVLLLTGARQVGKTTMLQHLAKGTGRRYVSMDRADYRDLAERDPVLFFQTFPPPLLIDEIQKAPKLLEQIKIMADESEEKGQFWLTGSQHFSMMRRVQETLAGRVGILHLYPFSQAEIEGRLPVEIPDFSISSLREKSAGKKPPLTEEIFRRIWTGGMPQVQETDEELRSLYFSSYIETYLFRDIMEMGEIRDTVRFMKFLRASAALTGQQVNYATLAEASDISQPTAKNWLQLLSGLGIIYLLQPYFNNELKRLVKSPKLYFCDTGLCAFLSFWPTPETLMAGAASGHYYENYVLMELIRNFSASPQKAEFSYYRDSRKNEIDIIIETGGELHPLEIKKSASPDSREIRKFKLLENPIIPTGSGGILCMAPEPLPLDEKNAIIPSWIF